MEKVNKKDSQIMFRLTKQEKEQFKIACIKADENVQRVLRSFVKDFIKNNGGDN